MPTTTDQIRGALGGGGTRAAQNKRIYGGQSPWGLQITLQGATTTFEHFVVSPIYLASASQSAVEVAGILLADYAREFHRPNIDTGATFNSIGPSDKGRVYVEAPGTYTVDVGPRTPQSLFLEFGFTHWKSGRFIRYPFMIPAADLVGPIFQDAMIQIVQGVAFRRSFTNPIAEATGSMDSFRSSLYSFSKAAGDLRVLGFGGLSGLRGGALTTAQLLGDIEGVMRAALFARISRRVAGRFASGQLRASVSAQITGPNQQFASVGDRLLSRFAGFEVGRGFGSIGL